MTLRIGRRYREAGFAALLSLLVLSACDETPEPEPGQLVRQAEALRLEGRTQSGVALLKTAIQQAPTNGEFRVLLARSYLELGDMDGAEKELVRARELGVAPNRITPLLLRTWLPRRRFEQILAELDRVGPEEALDAEALVTRGKAFEGLERSAEAERSFRLALARDPDNLDTQVALVRHLLRAEVWEGAESVLREALARHPGSGRLLGLKGDLAFRRGDFDVARVAYGEMLAVKPGNPTAQIALAQAEIGARAYGEAIVNLEAALRDLPQHRDANHLRALAALHTGDNQTARLYSERALAADSSYLPSQLVLGLASFRLGLLERALDSFEAVVAGDPSDQLATSMLAATRARLDQSEAPPVPASREDSLHLGKIAVVRSGDLDAARAYFQTQGVAFPPLLPDSDLSKTTVLQRLQAARDKDPGRAEDYLDLARLAARIDDLETAILWLEKAVSLARKSLLPRLYLAQAHLWLDRPALALAAMDAVTAAGSDDLRVLAATGLAHLHLGQANRAAVAFRTVVERETRSAPAHGLLALAYRDLGAKSQYRNQLQTILRLEPDNLRAKVAQVSLLAQDGQLRAARQDLEVLRRSAPGDPEIAELEGALAFLEGRPSEAVWSFKRALERRPSGRLAVKLALAQWRAGDEQASLDSLKSWLEQDPEDRRVLLALANHYLALDRLEAAEARYRSLLTLAPKTVAALNNLAWIRLRAGDGAAALDAARQADSLAPGRPRIMDTLALALAATGEREPALALLRRAAKVAPDDDDIARHLAALHAWPADRTDEAAVVRELISRDLVQVRP